jgi:hypothetical protein
MLSEKLQVTTEKQAKYIEKNSLDEIQVIKNFINTEDCN